jgi:hypothetical protein
MMGAAPKDCREIERDGYDFMCFQNIAGRILFYQEGNA